MRLVIERDTHEAEILRGCFLFCAGKMEDIFIIVIICRRCVCFSGLVNYGIVSSRMTQFLSSEVSSEEKMYVLY